MTRVPSRAGLVVWSGPPVGNSGPRVFTWVALASSLPTPSPLPPPPPGGHYSTERHGTERHVPETFKTLLYGTERNNKFKVNIDF